MCAAAALGGGRGGGRGRAQGEALDADEVMERHLEAQYATMLASGEATPEDVERFRLRRRAEEERELCEVLRATRAWELDASVSEARVALCHAAALDALERRGEAVATLEAFLAKAGGSSDACAPAALALAKLHFKGGNKRAASECCMRAVRAYARGECSAEDGEDAFHLAGWVSIHADDHTAAYTLWARGARALPDSEALHRQARKRAVWDANIPQALCAAAVAAAEDAKPSTRAGTETAALLGECEGGREAAEAAARQCMASDAEAASGLLGGTPAGGVCAFDREIDLEGFGVHAHRVHRTPALALFDPHAQRGELVFRTRNPLLTRLECAAVVEQVEGHIQRERGGIWGTVRRSSVRTTDVAVEDVPSLRGWLRELLRTRLCPLLAAAYPLLADGSSLGACGERVRVHDAFIVRYDAETDMSLSLPEHSDTSAMSFTLALNQPGEDFEGGGTWFEALGPHDPTDGCTPLGRVVDADCGHAVAFAGPLRHAGYPVRRGVRFILVLFLYVEGFAYGELLRRASEECARAADAEPERGAARADGPGTALKGGAEPKPSGDMPGGFVVYQQTTDLVKMLNRRVMSVLD